MKPNSPQESFFKLLLEKIKNPVCIIIILVLYTLNHYINIINTTDIVTFICVIFICIVLSKDTIYKCVDRICKKEETKVKEKTKVLLEKYKCNRKNDINLFLNNKNDSYISNKNLSMQNSEGDVKVYNLKHRKQS